MLWWVPLVMAAANGGRKYAETGDIKEAGKGAAMGGAVGLGIGSLVGGGAAAAGGAASGAGATGAGSGALATGGAATTASGAGAAAANSTAAAAKAGMAGKMAGLQQMGANAGKQAMISTTMQAAQPKTETTSPAGGLPQMQSASQGLNFGNMSPEHLRMMGMV